MNPRIHPTMDFAYQLVVCHHLLTMIGRKNPLWFLPAGDFVRRKALSAKLWIQQLYTEHLFRYYSICEGESNRRNYRLQTWLAVVTVLGLFLVALNWLGRPAYLRLKEKHDQAQARLFLAQGDFQNAWLCASRVIVVDPTNVPACRVMAELADQARSPMVLEWLRRMVEAEPTIENKLLLAKAGLRYQNPPYFLTAEIVKDLSVPGTNLAASRAVAASYFLATHQLAEAEAGFTAAVRLDPTNQLNVLNLAIVWLSQTNISKADQARAALDQLQTDPKYGRAAISSLVVERLAASDGAAALRYSSQLLASPQVTLAEQLQNLEVLQKFNRPEFTAKLMTLQQSAETNAFTVAQLSAWMMAHAMPSENLTWLAGLPIKLQIQRPVQLAMANGLVQKGDWQRLLEIAGMGDWDDLDFFRLALLSHACLQQGQPQEARLKWNQAVSQTHNRFGALAKLLELTETWNLEAERVVLLQSMLQNFPRERWLQQELAQVYFAAGNTSAMNQFCGRLALLFPTEIVWQNNQAATALLLNTNLSQAFQWAEVVYKRDPGNPHEASTYAFALHLLGRDEAGLELLQKLPPAQLEQPSVALYYGLLLTAVGNGRAAAPWLSIAQTKGSLWPEEKQLLAAAQAKIKAISP